jgi:hypothetical protein
MTTDLLDWHEEDQTVDPEAEYRMLLNGLRRTKGFGLFFVQCSPFGGEQIIQRVRADLADEMVAVLKLESSIEDGNVFKRIRDFLDTQPKTQVLFIQGLELSLLDYEESKKRLGWSSEKIFSYSWQGVPPVLINSQPTARTLPRQLSTPAWCSCCRFLPSNIWSTAPPTFLTGDRVWLSSLTMPTPLAANHSEFGKRATYRQYLDWTQAQRNRRILEIQSLLDAERLEAQDQYNLYFEQGNLFVASDRVGSGDRCL